MGLRRRRARGIDSDEGRQTDSRLALLVAVLGWEGVSMNADEQRAYDLANLHQLASGGEPLPTPEEIERERDAISARWSDSERRLRTVQPNPRPKLREPSTTLRARNSEPGTHDSY
jgi:hypothetical protein